MVAHAARPLLADPAPLFERYGTRRVHSDAVWRCVYRSRTGRGWEARVRIAGRLIYVGSADTQREAAALAAGFLLGRFGEDWPRLWRQSKGEAKRRSAKQRAAAYRVKWDAEAGCYRLAVRVLGRYEVATTAHRFEGKLARRFDTREAAEAFYAEWLSLQVGMFAPARDWWR